MKLQLPNTKYQIITNNQIPTIKTRRLEFGAWSLEFIWNLVLGIWCFIAINFLLLTFVSCSNGKAKGPDPSFSGYPDTPFTIKDSSKLIGGPLAQGKIGDVLLENDKIRVIIQKPSKNAGLFSFGGIIIDADRVRSQGEKGNDQFGSIFPFVNVEWTVNYTNYEVTSTGEQDGVKILRAAGTIDPWDYLDLDFVGEVAEGAVGQALTFSRRFDDRGNPFEIYDDLRGINTEVVTEYRLEEGKNYVRIDTTFKNGGSTDILMPVGDIVNGSGGLNFLIPGLGFSPDLMLQAGGDTTAVIYSGFDGVDVSYGYFYDLSQFKDADGNRLTSGSLSYSGVTFVALGEGILKILPLGTGGTPQINFSIPAGGERTITRYFVVGDGSASSILEAGMQALNVEAGEIKGTVITAGGMSVSGAAVAVQKKGGGTVVVLNTDAAGRFSGRLPAGSDPFSKALGGGQYRILVNKRGYHENGTAKAGTCDPEDVTLTSGAAVEVRCVLGEAGSVRIAGPVIDAGTGRPIAARLTIVGEDPSPEGSNAGNFEDIGAFKRPFGIIDNLYINARGTIGSTSGTSFDLEPGEYKFVFSHGTEYSISEKDVIVEAGVTSLLEGISLSRVVSTPGYISGDFHLHNITSPDSWIAPEKRVIGGAAEGLDVLHSSDHDYLFDYGPVIANLESRGLIPAGSFVSSIVGVEITPNHYGHLHAFPLTVDPESPTGGAIDWSDTEMDEISPAPDFCMSPAQIADAVNAFPGEQVVQLNHISDNPTGLPVAGGWVTSRFYLEMGAPPLSSYADPVERRLLPHTGGPSFPLQYGTSSLMFDGADTAELVIGFELHMLPSQFLKSTLPTWFNFLNLGMITTATGSSDSHDELFNNMSWPRNYVASSVDPKDGIGDSSQFDRDAYARAIKEHKVVISAGPFVTVEAQGDKGVSGTIGDTVTGRDIKLKISAKAPSWAWFDSIEIYANTEPIPIDDETGDAMSGVASDPAEFYKPYHVPHYAYKPSEAFRLSDGSLASWKNEDGAITAEVELNMTFEEDSWIVVLVRGTRDTPGFRSLFPLKTNVLIDPAKKPEFFDPLNLSEFHTAPEVGAFAFALANPVFIDADGDGAFTAKYIREGTSPLQ
jgi:hypothetical protein